MKRTAAVLALVAASFSAACDSTGPAATLEGQWLVTGYESDGVVASAVSGTAVFSSGGTLAFNVLVTFPGEPQDTVNTTYGWSLDGDTLTMTDAVDSSVWTVTFAQQGRRAVLALLFDASASLLTLDRPGEI